VKKYIIRTLGMLGQLYDENGEEMNLPNGTELYLASDVDEAACDKGGVVTCIACHERIDTRTDDHFNVEHTLIQCPNCKFTQPAP
jgi:transcriptional regulator of acetoin/glycerol metabolism